MLSVSLLKNILNEEYPLLEINMFKYKDIYFELKFYSYNNTDDIPIPDNDLLINSWISSLSDAKNYYNTKVDNIGNKYYYLKKNFRLNLLHQQKSLIQKAKDEFQYYLYEGTIIAQTELLKMYDSKYKNKKFDKNELNNLINYYLNILERTRVDILFYCDKNN